MRTRLLVLLLAYCGSSTAGPADYIFIPEIEQGELEVEFVAGAASERGEELRAGGLGIGYGFTPWWFSELFGNAAGASGESTRLEAFEWENRFLLTRPGRSSFDAGLVTELEIPRRGGEPQELKVGAMAQRAFGDTRLNLNLLLERSFGGDDEAQQEREIELGYQWQFRVPWRSALAFGLQGFGEVGPWDRWAPSERHLRDRIVNAAQVQAA